MPYKIAMTPVLAKEVEFFRSDLNFYLSISNLEKKNK